MSATESSDTPPFRLSALLSGHSDDVRALSADESSSTLFSSSRDGTARVWERRGPKEGRTGGWEEKRVFSAFHTGFVNAVAWLPKANAAADDPGFLLTGGQDALIHVYDLSSPADVPVQTLAGHGMNVCALHAAGTAIVSGSWDFTARIWNTESWECDRILEGHRAAVWDVLAISVAGGYEDCAITACADGLIRLFKPGSDSASVVFKGHTGPVRALAKVLPSDQSCTLFASASNDETIRIWNFAGDALTTLEGHSSFIYALVSLPKSCGGGMASSGEDGIVKIWNEEEGEEEQEILVPALSVWSLAALPNGDLAIACSDNLIWVFTRDEARRADEAMTVDYETRIAQRPKPAAKSTPALPLPVASAVDLAKPGAKDGEVKLVDIDGVMHAYQWTSGNWSNLGEVTAGPAPSEPRARARAKTEYEGSLYDFVVDIDIKDDEPALKLPYNLEDDPEEVSKAFVAAHELPDSYEERIAAFLGNL